MRASDFMFSLVLTVGIMAIMGSFFTSTFITNNVAINSTYNRTLNSMQDINQTTALILEQKKDTFIETNVTTSKNIISEFLDIVGWWFEKGVLVIKLIPKSLQLAVNMLDVGLNSIASILGIAYNPIRFIIISLLTVAVIFFILAVLVKWDV